MQRTLVLRLVDEPRPVPEAAVLRSWMSHSRRVRQLARTLRYVATSGKAAGKWNSLTGSSTVCIATDGGVNGQKPAR